MTKITGHTELQFEGKTLDYVIGALIIVEDGTHAMTWLGLYKGYGLTTQEDVDTWDSDTYLIETLFEKVLRPWVEKKPVVDTEAFSEVLRTEGVSLDDFQGLYDLFVQAISRDLFYEYFKNKE